MIGEAMRRLLDVLDGSGVAATVQLTPKGHPETTEQILARWFDALLEIAVEQSEGEG